MKVLSLTVAVPPVDAAAAELPVKVLSLTVTMPPRCRCRRQTMPAELPVKAPSVTVAVPEVVDAAAAAVARSCR